MHATLGKRLNTYAVDLFKGYDALANQTSDCRSEAHLQKISKYILIIYQAVI